MILKYIILVCTIRVAVGATFGTVVPIGGHVSDIALDERRGALYIANFGASRIDVMSTADNTLRAPISVPREPGTLALSPDGRFLVVGHYANWEAPVTMDPAVTVLDLDANVQQTFAMGSSPLAIAFGIGARALVVTSTEFLLLDPLTGEFETLEVQGQELTSQTLPVPFATFPPEILQASAGISGDGQTVYVLAEGAASAAIVQYRVVERDLRVIGITSTPPLGPRVVSVNLDGSNFVAGWTLMDPRFVLLAQFPYPTGKFNVGSHAFDYSRNLIYAQIPVGTAPTTPTPTPSETPEPTTPTASPVLTIFDADNLTVRERIQLKENLAGKSLLSADFRVMYAASDSGITVLPIGSLEENHRLVTDRETIIFRGNACDLQTITQAIGIVDPSGGQTDFRLSLPESTRGIRVSPSSGTAPARVQIDVDPAVFQNQKGTVAINLEIQSAAAINIPPPVRMLINTREPEQRGAFFDVPGKLVDILADPIRDRFYILRQDKNLLLVFDGTSFEQIGALRTGNTPVQMAMTRDLRYMIVTNDNSQFANVYDLDTLQPSIPIEFPSGHYPRSIAVSNRAMLATARSSSGPNTIDRIDFAARVANTLPSLGIYSNEINVDTVLTASPSGTMIFAAMPDGTVLLYDSSVDRFVASRKDLSEGSGAYAALTDQMFVVNNNLLNWSLVPTNKLETNTGSSSGFAYVDGYGLRTTSPSSSSPGVIQRVDLFTLEAIRPTKTVESPLLANELQTPTVGQIGQTILPFSRTLAPLANRTSIVLLTTSGFTILPWNFDEALAKPSIDRVISSADASEGVAPGSLVTIFGNNLSPVTAVNNEVPVPTTLGEACLTVNGVLLPMFRASPTQISAQLPFSVVGSAKMVLRAPGGTSDPFDFTILPGAPAVFRSGSAGPDTGLATIIRAKNNELATLSNPIHEEEDIIIFLTGLSRTAPPVEAGFPAPYDPLAVVLSGPQISLGGVSLPVLFAGLVPGQIGVYQINARIPFGIPGGIAVPLTISLAGQSTTLSVRVVK